MEEVYMGEGIASPTTEETADVAVEAGDAIARPDGEGDTEDTAIGALPEEVTEECPERSAPDYQKMAEEDLYALKAAIPELSALSSLSELAAPARYGALREAGLSPVEAYCASHSHLLIRARQDNRAHLAPSVGRTSSAVGARMSVSQLDEARTLFPSLSDREIEGLFRRVSGARSH